MRHSPDGRPGAAGEHPHGAPVKSAPGPAGSSAPAAAQPDGVEPGWTELVPGLKLSVTGTTLLMGWRWPFTVRMTVGGLPRRMFTASCSVHVIVAPAGRVPIYICDPSLALVSRTQQGSCPVTTLITTSVREGVGDTVTEGVFDGVGLAGGWVKPLVFEAVGWLCLPCVEIRW